MKQDTERLQVAYHDRASKIFFHLWQEFENSSRSINRETHEHDFQSLKRAYANQLNQDLQTLAGEILNDYRNTQHINDADLLLNQLSRQYMHRFVQKIDSF